MTDTVSLIQEAIINGELSFGEIADLYGVTRADVGLIAEELNDQIEDGDVDLIAEELNDLCRAFDNFDDDNFDDDNF
jgi:predicted HTH domain antitoxin